jgi:hypothetical protein
MQISKEEKFDLTGLSRREMANILDALTFYWSDSTSAKRDQRATEIAEMRDSIGMVLGITAGNRPVDRRDNYSSTIENSSSMKLFVAEVTSKAIQEGEEYNKIILRAASKQHAVSILDQESSLAKNYSVKELTYGGESGIILQGE